MPAGDSLPDLPLIVDAGVPGSALAFYGRWWQLETWLREVAYVELRAKHGRKWVAHLEGQAPKRSVRDRANAYMASADAGELLAYADVSDLFRLIEGHWELFAEVLPPERTWQGTADQLTQLRHRNAHCRRPHRDDLARIEQALRDVEPGAWRFYMSYLDTKGLSNSNDPLARSWLDHRHPTSARLAGHAAKKYDVRMRLAYSWRPWATEPDKNAISGTPGVLWHATWLMRGRTLNALELWSELSREPARTELLVHVLVDLGRVTATFAAIDEPKEVADAIGDMFDEILVTSREYHGGGSPEQFEKRWTEGAELLPRLVQVGSPLTRVDPLNPHTFSIFRA